MKPGSIWSQMWLYLFTCRTAINIRNIFHKSCQIKLCRNILRFADVNLKKKIVLTEMAFSYTAMSLIYMTNRNHSKNFLLYQIFLSKRGGVTPHEYLAECFHISLRIRVSWSESLLSAWKRIGYLAIHRRSSEDPDYSVWICRLNLVFVGRTCSFMGNTDNPFISTLDRTTKFVIRPFDCHA